MQIKSTSLTNDLHRDNLIMAPVVGAFGTFVEVVNLIF
jgi:hypothetical protein